MKQGLVVAPLVTTTAAMVVAQEAVAPEKVIFVCEHGAASKATHIFAIGCTRAVARRLQGEGRQLGGRAGRSGIRGST